MKYSLAILLAALTLQLAERRLTAAEAETVYPVAVLPFQERGADVKELGGKVTDLVFAGLVTNPDLFLVDREDMRKTFGEQELNLSGMVKPAEAIKIGQLTGAKIIVTGSVLQSDNSLVLVAKIFSSETSRVVGASVKGKANDALTDLAEQLSVEIGKTILAQADKLVAKAVTEKDRAQSIKKELGDASRPALWISVVERHVGHATIDPAAETELTLLGIDTGFAVVDNKKGDSHDADVLITGEGFSEFAGRVGNLTSVKARLEVKAVDRKSGRVLFSDRQTAVAVDLTEQIAGKTALQNAAASLAERLLPKLAKASNPEKN
jgi:TolB-like protein